MKNWKKWLFLPLWALLLLTLVSTAALVWVFVKGLEEFIPAYFIYVLSFYTLTVDCIACWKVLPGRIRQWCRRYRESAFGIRYHSDPDFRIRVSLTISLTTNLLFVVTNAVSILKYRSAWFGILTGYYGILALMRLFLMLYVRRNRIGADMTGELKRSRGCAVILLLVNLVLSASVLMILYQNKGKNYGNILIFLVALYTFYSLYHAIHSAIRYRKYKSPVMSTSRVVSLSSALVSMLMLETAMFAAFGGDMAVEDQRLMIILTGAGVSIAIITMSVYLIVRANLGLKAARQNKE